MEDDLAKLAELRRWIEERLEDIHEQENNYNSFLTLIDEKLKKSSFVKAAEMPIESAEEIKPRLLRRAKDNSILASVYMSDDEVSIIPSADVSFNQNTPPFRSYLIKKVLDPLKLNDEEKVNGGFLRKEMAFSYNVNLNGDLISNIKINNIGGQDKLNELLTKVTWTFNRMIENAAQKR